MTDTSGASGHQKLRVCDVCGAYLSVLDSDRRLADHFGGKVRESGRDNEAAANGDYIADAPWLPRTAEHAQDVQRRARKEKAKRGVGWDWECGGRDDRDFSGSSVVSRGRVS